MQIVVWLILQKLRSRLYLTVTYFSATSNGLKIIAIFGRILKLDVREADYSFVDMAIYPWIRGHKLQGQDLDIFPYLKRWFFELDD